MTSTIPHATPLEQAIVPNPIIVMPETPLGEVVLLMSQAQESSILANAYPSINSAYLEEARAGCVLIANEAELVGIFTIRDLVQLAASGRQPGSIQIRQVMVRQTASLERSQLQDPFTALKLLQTQQLSYLPIVDEARHIVGLVTASTLYQSIQPTDLLKPHLVSAVMTKNVVQASLGVSVLTIAKLMAENQSDYVIITNDEGAVTAHPEVPAYPVGIITDEDILQAQAIGLNFANVSASAVMNTPLACLSMQDSLWTAYQKMQRRHAKRMVVIGSQGELVGILTQANLRSLLEPVEMQALVESLQQRVAQLEQRQAELERLHQRDQDELAKRQAAQQVLQAREAQHRQLLEAAATGIWVFDRNQQTSFVNQHVLNSLGYSLNEMLGKPLSAFLEGDDQITLPTSDYFDGLAQPMVERNGHHTAETHTETRQEMRLRCKDSSYRWMMLSTKPLRNGSNDYLGMVTTLTDLGNTNPLDQQLHHLLSSTINVTGQAFLEALARQLSDLLAVACVMISQVVDDRLQTYVVWADGQLQSAFSYAIAPSPDKRTLQHGDYCCAQELQRHFPQAESLPLPNLESYLGVVLQASDGEAIGTIAVLDTKPILAARSLKTLLQTFAPRIVTEIDRQHTIDALQQTTHLLKVQLEQQSLAAQDGEKRFCDTADGMPVFLWMAYEREKRWFSNRTWIDFTGASRDDQLDHGWTEHIHPDDIQLYLDNYLEAFDARLPIQHEYRVRKKSTGEYHWILDSAAPRNNPDGSFAGYIGIGVDITDYKCTIEDLDNKLHQQRQTDEQRINAVVSILRRFRKPLATIVTAVTDLKTNTNNTKNPKRQLDQVQAALKHMGELLENGLIVNQVKESELTFNPETVDLVQLCDDIVGQVKKEHPDYNFRPNFWQDGIRGDRQLSNAILDPKLVQRILQCLLSNAVKYSSPGSTIYLNLIKGQKGQELVAIEIQDEGIGIPLEIQNKLFRAFRRANNVGDVPGDGLGLVIVKRCLDLHGGDITFNSKPGFTLFRVMLRVQFPRDDSTYSGGDSFRRK